MNEKNVFISYGHGHYDSVVKKVAEDLRGFGFEVFFDVDYLKVGDWERIIDEHIISCKYFIFMVSARSTSGEGYCLNELCRAGENNAVIIPVTLDNSLVPLSINKYQRFSLMDCLNPNGELIEAKYNDFLTNLKNVLSGDIKLGFSDREVRLKTCLKPVSSREDSFKYYSTFCGRKAAFQAFENFVQSNKNIFWINSRPGMGKTAFTSMLLWRYPEYVKAIHFCKFNNSDRVNPKTIICSIAYQLSEAIPAYKEKLLNLLDLESIYEKNAARIFEYLLIEPMRDIRPDKPVIVVIDALDECSWRGDNELCNVLARVKASIPSWMKFVLSSRNESEIRRTIYPIATEYILSANETEEDLRDYYKLQFPAASNDKIETLLVKSEGSFLYASEITKQIKDDNLSLEDIDFFPVGIYGFFNDCFSRIFGQDSDIEYESIKPLLEFLCISQEPVGVEFLENYLGWSEYDLKRVLARLSGLFPVHNNNIEPLHKSLIDWLTNADDVAQIFYISKKRGYQRLLEFIEKDFNAKNYENKYVIKYYDSTLIQLGLYDKLAESLDNYDFQRCVIEKLDFDFGLGRYIEELQELSSVLQEKCVELLSRPTFIQIFSEHRRLLYNSGMFFDLKRCGLSVALRTDNSDWGIEGEIGKVFYYYIVEDFTRAIRKAKNLLEHNEELIASDYLKSEIYNVKGLSERKLVLFDDAMESFEKSIEYVDRVIDAEVMPENGDPEFEKSLSYLIKGKIYFHMLEFSNANRSIKTAIKTLRRKIDEMPDNDKRISNLLFLAEDYRVFADNYIWQANYEMAEECLNECEAIYSENNACVDRYYIRYKYTKLFLRIMSRDADGVRQQLEKILEEETVSSYDKGQVNFYLALNAYMNGNKDNETTAEGIKWAQAGADSYDSIDAYLEMAECNLLNKLLSEQAGKKCRTEDEDNEFIEEWIKYITKLIQNGGEKVD